MQVLVAGFPVARAGRWLNFRVTESPVLPRGIPLLPALVLRLLLWGEASPLCGVSQHFRFWLLVQAHSVSEAESGIAGGEDEAPRESECRENNECGAEAGNVAEHGWQDTGYSEQRRNPQRIRPGVSDTESELRQT